MKIVIIAKQTFPFQGPRAFRVAELSEQLAKMGHEVHVYAYLGKYDYSNYTKETGVIVHNIKMRFVFESSSGIERYNFYDKVMIRLFKGLLSYPDIEFAFKVKHILKNEKDIDLLITVAMPHSIHWGTTYAQKKIKNGFPRCWISDCGDPYCLNPFIYVPKYFRYIEKKWCQATDFITVPSKDSFNGYFEEFHGKIRVIPQGFNFTKTPIAEYVSNSPIVFAFAGQIYDGKRDPLSFIKYLADVKTDFRFVLYTKTPVPEIYKQILNDRIVNIVGLNRKQCIEELSKADFLINIVNINSIQSPSKLIDYALTKRPILDIGNDFRQSSEFNEFMQGDYSHAHVVNNLEDYNIINVASKFVELYNEKMAPLK